MLSNLGEINHYRGVIIKYLAGSSGEFLGFALTQAFKDIANFNNKFTGEQNGYVTDNRLRFHDFFGYSLLTGDACDKNQNLVISRINWYLDYVLDLSQLHLGVAHPHIEFLRFISKYCSTWKTITIGIETSTSKNFCQLAKQTKLNSPGADRHYKNLYLDIGLDNLNLEWRDMVLGPSTDTIHKLEDFLKIRGSVEQFELARLDYVRRNQSIIDRAIK
jgi:hypothetical protein